MSKGGVNEFNCGVVNPDNVPCIYADNPASYHEDVGTRIIGAMVFGGIQRERIALNESSF